MKHLVSSNTVDEPLLAGLAVALTGIVIISAAALATSPSPLRLIAGVVASGGTGWLVTQLLRQSAANEQLRPLDLVMVSDPCRELINDLLKGASHPDPVFRELLTARLALFAEQVRDWSHGRLTFAGTEAWRTAYEQVLTAPDIDQYRSVAWLKSEHYWQDLPGKHGLQSNFTLLDQGLRIERLLILGWNLWPPELRLPRETIRRWIDDQHYRGVTILLVRECDLITEQDLLRDFGIYGERAVGELYVDDESRTVSFTLSFDLGAVEVAKEQWSRLKLFARPYAELLEGAPSLR